jgi:hypothetical protein
LKKKVWGGCALPGGYKCKNHIRQDVGKEK